MAIISLDRYSHGLIGQIVRAINKVIMCEMDHTPLNESVNDYDHIYKCSDLYGKRSLLHNFRIRSYNGCMFVNYLNLQVFTSILVGRKLNCNSQHVEKARSFWSSSRLLRQLNAYCGVAMSCDPTVGEESQDSQYMLSRVCHP